MSSLTLLLSMAHLGCNPPIETNTPPAIKFEGLEDGAKLNEGETVTLQVLVRDRDGDPTSTLTVASDVQGTLLEAVEATSGEPVSFDVSFVYNDDTEGVQTITATADDGKKDGVRVSTLVVDVNGAPTDPCVSVSPADPDADDDVLGVKDCDSIDPEFPDEVGRVVYLWTWTSDDPDKEPSSGRYSDPGGRLFASKTDKGETWTFCLEALESQDGVNPSPTGISSTTCAAVTIGNQAPAAPTVAIYPADPGPNDDLLCAIVTDSVDPDGDDVTYTYQWARKKAGVFVDEAGETDAALGADATAEDQNWRCSVLANDGEADAAAAATAEVTIADRETDASAGSVKQSGTTANDNVGLYAVGVRLMNGSTTNDVVAGYPSDEDGADAGLVSIWQSSGLLSNDVPDLNVRASDGARLGQPLLAVGDLNADGLSELALAATGDPDGGVDPAVYLVFGESQFAGNDLNLAFASGIVTVSPSNPANGHGFGAALASGWFTGGDGVDDLVVSQVSDLRKNKVFVFDSSRLTADSELDSGVADLTFTAASTTSDFGRSLAAADLDGDGIDELAVGAPDEVAGVSLFLGSSISAGGSFEATDADVTVEDANGTELGFAVAAALVTDDGFADLVVSAPARNANRGSIYVFFGEAWTPGTVLALGDANVLVNGVDDGGRFGDRVTAIGDRGMDGLDEVAVGAPLADPNGDDSGRVYLFNGSDLAGVVLTDADLAAFVVNGVEAGDQLDAVGPMGDLDGDGQIDWAAGAPFNNSGGNNAGQLYLFLSGD